jgi:hypothetical protein
MQASPSSDTTLPALAPVSLLSLFTTNPPELPRPLAWQAAISGLCTSVASRQTYGFLRGSISPKPVASPESRRRIKLVTNPYDYLGFPGSAKLLSMNVSDSIGCAAPDRFFPAVERIRNSGPGWLSDALAPGILFQSSRATIRDRSVPSRSRTKFGGWQG